jgi:uncharacterized membrane protein YeaQ/YmgE (transglycosylase-associated protein family)
LLSAAAAIVGAPNAQFLALLLIGGVIGWSTTKLSHVHADVRAGALLLSGVTGAWVAAELAVRAGVGQRCADAVLISGAIGAALFCVACRGLPLANRSPEDIAVRH